MLFSIALLIVIVFLAYKVAPFELFGVHRSVRYGPLLVKAGDYDHAVHSDHPEAPSLLAQYLQTKPKQKLKAGSTPKETAPGDEEGKEE